MFFYGSLMSYELLRDAHHQAVTGGELLSQLKISQCAVNPDSYSDN